MDKRLTVWCHAHEGLHERKPGFFSSPLSKVVGGISYPVMACDECMAKPGNVVRAAYLRMTGGK